MKDDLGDRIRANPKYQELVSKRNAYGWIMTAALMIVYYGYILLVAFNKDFLATKTGAGVTSYGIPIGIGVILFTIIITGIYIRRDRRGGAGGLGGRRLAGRILPGAAMKTLLTEVFGLALPVIHLHGLDPLQGARGMKAWVQGTFKDLQCGSSRNLNRRSSSLCQRLD